MRSLPPIDMRVCSFSPSIIAVFIGSLLAPLQLFADVDPITEGERKWHGTANASYKGGDRHIGSLGFTFPFAQSDDALLFLDFRGRLDDRDTEEYNFGLAYRKILASNWIFGAYGFFDRQTSAFGNEFDQGTVGFEFLNEDWDFRVNGYLPELNGKDAGSAPGFGTISVSGNQFFINSQRLEERAYYGGDYEIGRRIAVFGDNQNELRVFGGGYYFDNDAAGYPHIGGWRLRAEARLFDLALLGEGSRMTLTGEIQYDQVRETQGFGGIAIQIPLGKWGRGGGGSSPIGASSSYRSLSVLERRMYDPIVRDIDIVTQRVESGFESELALDAEGDPLLLANAQFDLDGAIANAGANGSVAVSGAVATNGSTLLPGQRLASVTATQTVVGAESGIRVTGQLPGSQGIITGAPGAPVLTLATNNIVDSLHIRGGSNGIFGSNVGSTEIRNNQISAASSHGVDMTGIFTGMVVNNLVSGNGGEGFLLQGNNDGVITGNTFTGNTEDGIQIVNNNGTFTGNTARGNGDEGFDFEDNNGTISGNLASANGDDGFNLDNNNGTISGNTSTGNVGDGIDLDDNNGTFRGNTASGNGENGFEISNNVGSLSTNTASMNTADGFNMIGNTGTISGNTAATNGGDGFEIFVNSPTGVISSNVATNNIAAGYNISNNTGNVVANGGSGNGSNDTAP